MSHKKQPLSPRTSLLNDDSDQTWFRGRDIIPITQSSSKKPHDMCTLFFSVTLWECQIKVKPPRVIFGCIHNFSVNVNFPSNEMLIQYHKIGNNWGDYKINHGASQSAGAIEYTDCSSRRGVWRPQPNECLGYNAKQSDGEVSVLELWRMPSTLLLPGQLWSGVVVPVRVPSMDPIEMFNCGQTNNWC